MKLSLHPLLLCEPIYIFFDSDLETKESGRDNISVRYIETLLHFH